MRALGLVFIILLAGCTTQDLPELPAEMHAPAVELELLANVSAGYPMGPSTWAVVGTIVNPTNETVRASEIVLDLVLFIPSDGGREIRMSARLMDRVGWHAGCDVRGCPPRSKLVLTPGNSTPYRITLAVPDGEATRMGLDAARITRAWANGASPDATIWTLAVGGLKWDGHLEGPSYALEKGSVSNHNSCEISNAYVLVVARSSRGRVVDVEGAWVSPIDVPPNSSGTFERVYFYDQFDADGHNFIALAEAETCRNFATTAALAPTAAS